jgi:hypothetical protein
MNIGALLLYLAFPGIFLGVASVTPGKVYFLKGVCIALAYFSLVLLDGMICVPGPMGIPGKDSSPFGLVFLVVSVWAFILVGHGGNSGKKDHPE